MIDPAAFFPHWKRLCSRFARPYDEAQALDYLGYLDDAGMSTEMACAAAKDLWARAEFFPRPADFLATEEAAGWRAALEWARKWSPTLGATEAMALNAAIPKQARRALEEIGGIDMLREQKNLLRVREAFREAFERAVGQEIEAGAQVQLLHPGGDYDPLTPETRARRVEDLKSLIEVMGVNVRVLHQPGDV